MSEAIVAGSEHPYAELQRLAREFHHLQAERSREGIEGSWRRRQGRVLTQLEQRFDLLLERWVATPEERERWRAHLYDGAAAPDVPPATSRVVYVGRSEVGSTLTIHEGPEHAWEIAIDGKRTDRLAGRADVEHGFVQHGIRFEEVFTASPQAQQALVAYLEMPRGEPPWPVAAELVADGLIDHHFSLTARGRRLWKRTQAA